MANKPWDKPGRAQYIGYPQVAAAITAADQYTTPSYFAAAREDPHPGQINVSISGTFTGTLTLQRCFNADQVDDDDNPVDEVWTDVKTYTVPAEDNVEYYNWGVKYRLGVKHGASFSGTANVLLNQA
jgi:hypothetical protein